MAMLRILVLAGLAISLAGCTTSGGTTAQGGSSSVLTKSELKAYCEDEGSEFGDPACP